MCPVQSRPSEKVVVQKISLELRYSVSTFLVILLELLLLVMKTNKVLPTKQSGGQKRKLFDQNISNENKPTENKTEKNKKAPLKAEIIITLKALEKEHEALKRENEQLKIKIVELEEQSKQSKLIAKGNEVAEELDLSFGPRYCKICNFEAEDGYQLDGHFWAEHDEDEESTKLLECHRCAESFSFLKDLMIHKKKKHTEIVDICWNFSNDACPFGDVKCWFQHKVDPNVNSNNSGNKSVKCNICGKISNNKKDFMKHRKEKHEETLQICKLLKNGNCTYKERCLFSHQNVQISDNSKNEITSELTEKPFDNVIKEN